MTDSKAILATAVKAADDKRGEDIVALDMSKVSLLADYFLIVTGNSERQVMAIVDSIEDQLAANDVHVRSIEGRKGSKWILMDFGDVVIHVFTPEERQQYNLEQFWQDAPLVDVQEWMAAE
ncbi:ribosome silencing factor [Lacticaseibacillus pantheris]|jgi:ribosome-associated protein|uniref:Ribosomal silencing factor RsfS n=1 Tax=Lacticaseibacillus pantheris DSM 15945 = JCM 12539 = NBRC 106106 TaxID=1423783 RepID=A0A0R1UAR4_9LACO|nr:ribosome silencing factor [Lacticaseibacillus pantheris]KRL86875.1 Iojap family protein [Lacticaseibacillus pantheris DSM 15945 = JCM 12539 = NBRC 106106]WKF84555.1 ribosome silencing factor [Lacticaseibacillus pantheris]